MVARRREKGGDPLPVTLVVQDHGGVTGLSRYSSMLHRELREVRGLRVSLAPVRSPTLPRIVERVSKRRGWDIERFLENYPVAWPDGVTGVVHLTHRTQANLLWRRRHRPLIVTVHDVIHYQYRHDPSMHIYRHGVQAWFDRLSIRALRRADAIVASSESTRQALINEAGIAPDRVFTIHLGVDQDQFQPGPVPDAFYQRYGLSRDVPYVLHVSTEEPRKNVSGLIQAFAAVRERQPAAVLLKIGRPLYPEARERHRSLADQLGVSETVRWVDEVRDEDLAHFYNAARLMAFPSRAEGFGLPVLEAMACGLPVVCSNATSLPEVAEDAALQVAPDDVVGLAEAICTLLTDAGLRQRLGRAGAARAAGFSWARTARRTAEVYASTWEALHA